MFIDADAHVIECMDTWDYFPKSMAYMRPAAMAFEPGQIPEYLGEDTTRGFLIDGLLFRQPINTDEETGTSADIREMRDIPGRLKEMDELGIETQVLYPTMLLSELTKRPELEVAICESYNRWVADRCRESGGRLRFVASLPTRSIPDALAEMRRVKEDGAVGIFRRGFEADERRASDAYFDPFYVQAQDLELPVCFHIARPYSGHHQATTVLQKMIFGPSFTIDAFLAILMEGTWKRFPTLKFGFIEVAAGWLSYCLWLGRFDSLSSNRQTTERAAVHEGYNTILEEARLFITCEVSEDLPGLISLAGDNRFLVGSDFGHADRSTYVEAHQRIAARPDLDAVSIEKLTRTNALAFYGLS